MPIFSVENHHCADCGKPDTALLGENEKEVIRSYYENEYGEQWIGVFRPSSDDPYIVGGDAGWNEKYYLDEKHGRSVKKLVLNKGERMWLDSFVYVVKRLRNES